MKTIPVPVRIGAGLLLGFLLLSGTDLGGGPLLQRILLQAALALLVGLGVYLLTGWGYARMMQRGRKGYHTNIPADEREFYDFIGRRTLFAAMLLGFLFAVTSLIQPVMSLFTFAFGVGLGGAFCLSKFLHMGKRAQENEGERG